jgi:Arc/MetJ-type ribon-helix-helix transcriptional regulator
MGHLQEKSAMQINLPADLERSLLTEVQSGHFASVDDAITEAVRLLLQRAPGEGEPEPLGAVEPTSPGHRPIWEVFEEISASIPDEEWARLPVDGAEQHDHYIYGTPRRPAP